MASKRFEKRQLLGAGTFGKVFLAVSKENNEKFAIKEVRVSGLTTKDLNQVMTEVSVLAYSKHVNIIRYKTAYIERGILNVVMEYADDGDLHQRVNTQKRLSQHLPEEVILDWFIQICSGICYLHGKNILHRDLKTQNIFLTKNQTVKIGDFGISKVLEHTADHARTAVGTPYFLSPEICQRQPYNQKSDMWAIGCVVYELASLCYPFEGSDFNQLVVVILHGKFKPIPEMYSSLLRDLVAVLLQSKSELRPSAETILCLPDLKAYLNSYIRHLQTSATASPRPPTASPRPHTASPRPPTTARVDKENIVPGITERPPKPRKHSLATPRTRPPLKEKRCYSDEENSIHDPNKRPKLSLKPPPINSLYKKAINQRRASLIKRQPSKPDSERDTPMDVSKPDSVHESDVEMNDDVFTTVVPKPVVKPKIDSTTYTVKKPAPNSIDDDVMRILYDQGLTQKENLMKTSEGLRFFLEQKMGCDRFFRSYLALKDVLLAKNDDGIENWKRFQVRMGETGQFWPVLFHLVQLDNLFETL